MRPVLVLSALAAFVASPLVAQPPVPPAPSDAEAEPAVPAALTTQGLNGRILAELRAQAANRAAAAAQYKGAVAVTNQQTVEIQRDANESEADYAARLAAWRACTGGDKAACTPPR